MKKVDSNAHGWSTRISSMIKWIRISRLSIETFLSLQGSAGTVVRLTLEREGLGGMVRVEVSLKRAALFEQGYRGVPAAAVTERGYHPGNAPKEGKP